MAKTPSRSRPVAPEPWQPRFGIGSLLMVTLVVSVMAAAGYYLFRVIRQGERQVQLAFVLFTVAGPLLVLLVVSVTRRLLEFLRRHRPTPRSTPKSKVQDPLA